MTIRPARLTDFDHLETFVWQAIFPAFDVDGLTDAQRAENDQLVENARTEAVEALSQPFFGVFVAIEPKSRRLVGYVIADARPRAYAEIRRLIVKRSHQGKGVAELLLDEASEFIGRDRAVSLAVRHYNARAIAFFTKHGFSDTGETTGNHAIPRTLMLREANETVTAQPDTAADTQQDFFGYDFPSAADEPVFEALPDYNLTTDETPLFETGANALRTVDPEELEPEETTLSDDQLSVLEAFIAKARAQKKGGQTPVVAKKPVQPAQPVQRPRSAPRAVPRKPEVEATPAGRRDIPFEVDFGAGIEKRPIATEAPAGVQGPKPSFSFDFAALDESSEATEHVVAPAPEPDRPAAATETTTAPSATYSASAPVNDRGRTVATAANDAIPTTAAEKRATSTKDCPDCATALPVAARFCFVCGHPQPLESEVASPAAERILREIRHTDEEPLALRELPPLGEEAVSDRQEELTDRLDLGGVGDDAGTADVKDSAKEKTTKSAVSDTADSGINPSVGSASRPTEKATEDNAILSSPAELRKAFRRYLEDRIKAYFGERKLGKFLKLLDESTSFQQVRDGSLASLGNWLNDQPDGDLARTRRRNVFADLTEYFIVETAGDLNGNILPQRLLRHQSVDWRTADLFQLVMDYLDFNAENETIYTDFVRMPPRALRNATRSFLHAAKDERVFFICDQSLISQAKNGFAVTDAGIYWKNVLQPAGAATFTTMKEPRLEQGHVLIDGQFFDAGARLNLKVAVLLDKLRRMR